MQGLFTIKSFHNVDIMKLQDLEFKLVKDVVLNDPGSSDSSRRQVHKTGRRICKRDKGP